MSFVKKIPAVKVNSAFKLSLEPNPVKKFTTAQAAAQQDVINQIHAVSKNLFHSNQAVNVNGLIKTDVRYANGVQVSDLTQAMKEYDLVIRVSCSGEHSALAMVSPDDLSNGKVVSSRTGSFALAIENNFIRGIDLV